MDMTTFQSRMERDGWVVLENCVPRELIGWMREDMQFALGVCREIQEANGVADNTAGTVHHLPAIYSCRSFLDFLETNPAHPYIEHWLAGKYILQSFGGNFNFPENSYASAIHRDIRRYQAEPLVVNTLVMLDDFTAENGGTWMGAMIDLAHKPDVETFRRTAKQVIAPAGSILIFDSNLWHAAGQNLSNMPRRSVTPMFCRPYVKPGFDYCRALWPYVPQMSGRLQQILGYRARIPETLTQWYQPPEKRCYQGDQG